MTKLVFLPRGVTAPGAAQVDAAAAAQVGAAVAAVPAALVDLISEGGER